MAADFLANAKPVQGGAPADFLARAKPVSASSPAPSISAAPPESWLHQAEDDFTQGGTRTVLGRIGGMMQGRGDKGYSGIDSGVSKGAADLMGSPVLGLLHAGESAQSIPDHPVKGVLGTIGGLLESVTIPSMMMGGEGAAAAIDAIPSTTHAGQMFNNLNTTLASHPVPLKAALAPLQRATEIGARGSNLPKAVSDLLSRSQGLSDMTFPEARDFQSSLSDLSASDKLAMNGRMRGGVAQLNKGLYTDLYDAADAHPDQLGDVYGDAMKEFRQASQLKSGMKTAAKMAVGAGAAGIGGSILAPHLKSLIGK
jgi:hypothetical protein